MAPRWFFSEKRKSDINRDPIESEFFTTETLDSMTNALVRETIQNSLDAATGNGPVRVRFSFSPANKLVPQNTRQLYFASLWPHIESRQSGLREIPRPDDPVSFLVIEDFGTRGLGGDISQHEDAELESKNDFYYFWRNVGRSVKKSLDRGRWGLGKTVFQASSRINAFFGLTVREEDGKCFLMGQSVLKIHKVGATSYEPYGYFGEFKDELAMPVEDEAEISHFCRNFGLTRKTEAGLSIVIPYPDQEIQRKAVATSVINHYFYPILSGDLVVEFVANGKTIVLDPELLPAYVGKLEADGKAGIGPLLSLAKWAIALPPELIVRLLAPEARKRPRLTEDLFDEETLNRLRFDFDEGERVALEVPLFIKAKEWDKPRETFFRVYLERDSGLQKPEDHFIRQGITISEVSSVNTKGVRAIVSIEELELATFLGDSENPAHTQWERNNRHFKGKYELAPTTLDFIKTSTRIIAHILSRPAKQLEENLLKDFFSVPMGDMQVRIKEDAPGGAHEKEQRSDFPSIHIDPRNKSICLSQLQGGFRVHGNPKAHAAPKSIAVFMAYEVRRGNPFKKYLPLDFEVDKPPIQIRLTNAKLILATQNLIHIAPEGVDFSLSVTGYDRRRDLRVKTQTVGESR